MSDDPVATIAAAVVAWHAAGRDVGEAVALALVEAARAVGGPDQLLANRPGSWEADLTRQILVAGGAYLDD